MKQLIYVLQFRGSGSPADDTGTVLKASTKSGSCRFETSVGAEGIRGTFDCSGAESASFESEVRIGAGGRFQEDGTITFGDSRNRIHFSTVGEGHLGPSADPKLQHGTVMWRVDRGEGQFEDATGLITSNFTVSDQGEVVDNQFGVLFVK
jgi:hypothetical protein